MDKREGKRERGGGGGGEETGVREVRERGREGKG